VELRGTAPRSIYPLLTLTDYILHHTQYIVNTGYDIFLTVPFRSYPIFINS